VSATLSRLDAGEVTEFINREGDLADKHQYGEWLALWNPERALYLIPMEWQQTGPSRHVAVIRDNYARLGDRIRRLQSGNAHMQDPPSLLCRVISLLEVTDGPEDQSATARSKFVCMEARPDREVLWGGEVIHTLGRRHDGHLEMWTKEVRLVNVARPMQALGFIM